MTLSRSSRGEEPSLRIIYEFPEALSREHKVFKLETNYRSTPEILGTCKHLDRVQPQAVSEDAIACETLA
jgi:superfamily I DNA/RNA helicase